MSKWQDVLTLIAMIPQGKDADGFITPPIERSRSVFCNVISVGQAEFYKAAQADIRVETKCKIYTADYEGERLCELNGKRYTILRTFSPNNGEFIELSLTDIKQSQEGADNGTV